MSDDDLRINTLHRFAKHSPRLTLQEYSHCEVPAGCGGAVLRWVDPARGRRVRVRVVAIGAVDTWLDGQPVTGDRVPLGPGPHVLTLHFESLGRTRWRGRDLVLPAPVPFAVSLHPDRGPRQRDGNEHLPPLARVERWAPGPFAEPPIAPDYDDRTWGTIVAADDALLAQLPDDVRPIFDRARTEAPSLRAIDGTGDVWARIAFALEEPL